MMDRAARDAIAGALDDTLVVEAAAGTGKTTELVNRILRILATGRAKVDGIVAVTFTEKAAGELKLRLRQALEEQRAAAASPAEREALDEALTKLEEAHVNTIHGFCADLLRERPVEARVDPLFSVLTESQAQRLFEEAFGDWLQQQLAEPPEGVRRALRRSIGASFSKAATRAAPEGPVDRLRRAAWELADWRDFPAAWTRPPFDRTGEIDRLVEALHALAAMTDHPSYARDTLFLDTAAVRDLSTEMTLERELGAPEYDAWEARLVDLSRHRDFSRVRKGRGPGYRPGVTRDAVMAAIESFRAHLDRFRLAADADLAAALQPELRAAVARYELLKGRIGALDFLDLLLKARDLIRGNDAVRRGFQARFTHLFVDEFQDTDPLQAEILMLLAAADPAATDWRTAVPVAGRLFVVGDPKQSIYRFRRADVAIYKDVCERLVAGGARLVRLTTSFRSVPEIQACVNAAFSRVLTGDPVTLQAGYVPLAPDRQAIAGQPALVALPVPRPYGVRNLSAPAMESSLPQAVAAFVEWIVNESGWKVSHRKTRAERPERVQPGEVCILFRRFLSFGEDVTQPYVQALEARGIPHVLVGGKSFHEREEVETLRAALAAIEWPDDELSMFATLRGALFAIGDEELLEWKFRYRGFHPFRIPDEAGGLAHLRPIAESLRTIRELHRRRNWRPMAETIQDLLGRTRAHVAFVLRRGGEQALANVLHVAELARQYEADGGLSFRGFVEELRRAAETAQAAEAPVLEEGSGGVRMMTVHKAKGLEFPIVVLADLTCRLSRADAGRWLDPDRQLCALKLGGWAPMDLVWHGPEEAARDKAEAERLAYVAATRARDVLVIPGVGDAPYEGGWLEPLNAAIYPPPPQRRQPSAARGCPPFPSKDSVLARPEGDPARPETVAPGRYVFAQGAAAYSVVWWDPHVLKLEAAPTFGLRRDDLIMKDGDMFAVDARLAEYERWASERQATNAAASAPTVRVETATAWAAAGHGDQATEYTDGRGDRATERTDGHGNQATEYTDGRGDRATEYTDGHGNQATEYTDRHGNQATERTGGHGDQATERTDGHGDQATEYTDGRGNQATERTDGHGDRATERPDALGSERWLGIEIVALPDAGDRPRGARFGTLVHAVLATVSLDATAEAIAATANTQARLLAPPPPSEEVRAAAEVVTRVLRHDLMARARRSARIRRETPVSWRQSDGLLIEGVLDLAFDEGANTIVVDFKTDHELSAGESRYRAQLRQYVTAVARATGRDTQGVLFKV
ncbi:MAG TPA: UvrD-helicase domain-containing protein [Vicinamibacterales bacterium]|nr:UvrD-helicase domain-containing protein [Vicinamibacterales bacterium]